MYEECLPETTAELYPNICRFKAGVAKECIGEILREQLYGVQYDPEEVPTLSRSLADSIKNKLKGNSTARAADSAPDLAAVNVK